MGVPKTAIPRVLLWGDSLTEGKPGASYAERLESLLPGFQLVNRGRGGDTVGSLLRRLDMEPLPPMKRRSAAAVLWVGVNDVYADLHPSYGLWKTAMRQPPTRDRDEYRVIYQRIVSGLIHHARRIIAIPPLFVGENPASDLNHKLREMSDVIADIAADSPNIDFLDIHSALPLDQDDPPRFLPANPWSKLADTVVGMEERYYDRASERRGLAWTYDGIHLNSRGAVAVANAVAEALRG